MQPVILIIEDESSIADVLAWNLRQQGYSVEVEHDGRSGLNRVRTAKPDLVVLDLMLPVIDGLQVCREIKADKATRHIPVLMLTARGAETDEIVGFNMGADDYVTKPFRVQPLMHRISALLRRADTEESGTVPLNLHGLQIDRENFRFEVDGVEHELTPTEFRMLWTLMAQPGRPFSRSELMETARGDDANALERTIDVHIRALRRKLGSKANVIETVRGVGYRIARP